MVLHTVKGFLLGGWLCMICIKTRSRQWKFTILASFTSSRVPTVIQLIFHHLSSATPAAWEATLPPSLSRLFCSQTLTSSTGHRSPIILSAQMQCLLISGCCSVFSFRVVLKKSGVLYIMSLLYKRGEWWSSGCWMANREVWGSNPGQGRNLVRDFCSTCAPCQLGYDEYTDSGKMKQ